MPTKLNDLKPKLLFITNLLPFPLDNGGKIKTYGTLCMLKDFYEIDLFCFVEKKEYLKYTVEIEKLGINTKCIVKSIVFKSNYILSFSQIVNSIFSKYPYVVLKFYSKLMKRCLLEKIKSSKYNSVYIDHLPLFQYAEYLSKFERSFIILDQHNIESEIIKRRLDNTVNPFNRIFLKNEYRKLNAYEVSSCKRSDLILAITSRDQSKIMEITGNLFNCFVAPFFLKDRQNLYSSINKFKKNILFIGTISWYPNEDAIMWFYNNIFLPFNFGNKGWTLTILGNNVTMKVLQLKNDSNVNIIGYVPDIRTYIENASVGIVPIRIGGGMRIKVLDLFSYGLPVVSTSIGCEGIPVTNKENVLIADTPYDFSNSLSLLESNETLREKLSKNALKFIEDNYSFMSAKKEFSKILTKIYEKN